MLSMIPRCNSSCSCSNSSAALQRQARGKSRSEDTFVAAIFEFVLQWQAHHSEGIALAALAHCIKLHSRDGDDLEVLLSYLALKISMRARKSSTVMMGADGGGIDCVDKSPLCEVWFGMVGRQPGVTIG